MVTHSQQTTAHTAAKQFLSQPTLREKADKDGLDSVLETFNTDISTDEFKQAIRALTIEHVADTDDSDTHDPGEKKALYTVTCVCTCKCTLSC